MLPITLLCENKVASLLSAPNGLSLALSDLAEQNSVSVPILSSGSIATSSASTEICELNLQLPYPRINIVCSSLKNTRREKFCLLSGTADLSLEVFSSANLIADAERWSHYYVAAIGNLLSANVGDWGDGVFFSGIYDVRFQPLVAGGFGFLQSARLNLTLNVTRG